MRILKRTTTLTKEETYRSANEAPETVVTERVEVTQEWDKDEYVAVLGIPREAEIHETSMYQGKVYIRWATREKK